MLRDFSTRPGLLCAALCLAAPLACKGSNTNVQVAGPDDGAGAAEASGRDTADAPARARPPVETIDISGSVSGIQDMLGAGSDLYNAWSPPEPGAQPVDILNFIAIALQQEGYAPGFLEGLDLDGVHAFELGIPREGQPQVTDADIAIAAGFATIDAVRVIESLPSNLRPQPLGNKLWQLREGELELLFRAQDDAMEVASAMDKLDRAASLRGQVTSSERVQLRAKDLPPGGIDIAELLPVPGAAVLSSILDETRAVELTGDFGRQRDMLVRLAAEAPFERLGLDPVGPATQAPSQLATVMPPGAMGVFVMPWGDPGLLHNLLRKQLPVDAIPAPFDGYVDVVLAGAHQILDDIQDEILTAAYLDDGDMTIVLAAKVRDEASARKALRDLFGSAERALDDYLALTGTNDDFKFRVDFAQDKARAGRFKGDLFTVTVPKAMQSETEDIGFLLGRRTPKLEVASLVADGTMVVAIGTGQRGFMSALGRRLGKASSGGLEAGKGLERARAITQGCQYCIAVDATEAGELVLTIIADDSDEPESVRKLARSAAKKLDKLDVSGEVAMSLRLQEGLGVFAIGVPQSLLFPGADKIRTVVTLFEGIDEAREKAWAAATATSSP